jgi:hypothetical protein
MARPQCDTTLDKIFIDSFIVAISLGQRGKEHKFAKKIACCQEGEIACTEGPSFYSFREDWGAGFCCSYFVFTEFSICY